MCIACVDATDKLCTVPVGDEEGQYLNVTAQVQVLSTVGFNTKLNTSRKVVHNQLTHFNTTQEHAENVSTQINTNQRAYQSIEITELHK